MQLVWLYFLKTDSSGCLKLWVCSNHPGHDERRSGGHSSHISENAFLNCNQSHL